MVETKHRRSRWTYKTQARGDKESSEHAAGSSAVEVHSPGLYQSSRSPIRVRRGLIALQ
jgi:hypothetical protein